MNCDWNWYVFGTGESVIIHCSGQTISPHTEGIMLCAGEETFEVAGRASVMGLDEIGRLVTGLVKDRLLEYRLQVL